MGLSAITGCSSSSNNTLPGNIVFTESGILKGYLDSGTLIFKGIPFAAPPVGNLRWHAPQDPAHWTGIRDATKAASVCSQQIYSQQWVAATPVSSASSYTGSEDCLYLDVYRPQTVTTSKLPVFVWIHGGANILGGASSYDGTALATRENMVVVVIQYRLGPFGYFSNYAWLDGSESKVNASGNFGTLDQIKALNWVQKNIAAFGGDPAKVTVGGQSAGGGATLDMIISPLTTGLFRSAIAMSPGLSLVTPDPADPNNATLSNTMLNWLLQDDGTVVTGDWAGADAHRLSMSNAAVKQYLRNKSALKLEMAAIQANYHLNPSLGERMPFHMPFGDGTVLPADWATAIAAGNFRHVPLILGNVKQEDKTFMPLYGPKLKPFGVPSGSYNWFDLLQGVMIPDSRHLSLADVLPTDADVEFYNNVGTEASRMWKARTDAIAHTIMEEASSNSVYFYLFGWDGGGDTAIADFQIIFGAAHAADIPFWFGWPDTKVTSYGEFSFTAANRPGRTLLANAMMDYLGAFVYTGNPNPSGSTLQSWSKWSPAAPNLLTLNATKTSLDLGTASYELTVAGVQAEIDAYGILFKVLCSLLP